MLFTTFKKNYVNKKFVRVVDKIDTLTTVKLGPVVTNSMGPWEYVYFDRKRLYGKAITWDQKMELIRVIYNLNS